MLEGTAGGLLGVIASVFGAIFSFVTIIVFSFYFSASAPQIKRFLASWLKPERQVVFIEVWDISVRKAGGFVISKLVLATVAAAAHVAFFWIIDIPYWLPMGIFAGFVSQFIPTIGTYIGITVPAFFAAFNDPWDVLWIVLFATIYQQIENYIFSPRISTATMAMPRAGQPPERHASTWVLLDKRARKTHQSCKLLCVLSIICDRGDRYLSSDLFENVSVI